VNAPTPLAERLARLIAADGPISVATYMAHCLGDPQHGYYTTRDPFGAAGDFTTAPEISQMFGELLGLWAAAVWQQMGAPARVLLVELGPGRGTLMADALRAARALPGFLAATSVHLVETSPVLRRRQQEALTGLGMPLGWHDDLGTLPDAPLLVLANEFFDALPAFQAVRTADGWRERVVGLNGVGRLAFGLAPQPLPRFERMLPAGLLSGPHGSVFEWRPDGPLTELCRRLTDFGGAALVIDYGHTVSGFGDTLQALQRHRFVDPLVAPGESDLTAHVDFAALARAAARLGVSVHGPLTQGDLLRRLGIAERATALKRRATTDQAAAIDSALARLTGEDPAAMGRLFKAIAFGSPGLGPLPGFDM
jgi:SAM-dependent MidA family methyltransferase